MSLDLDPAAAAEDLSHLEPIAANAADSLENQKAMLAAGKAVTRYVIAIANQWLNGDLTAHQEIAGIISDMVIAVFATESALLRAEKMLMAKKRTSADIAIIMSKVLSVRLYDRLRSLVSRVMPAVMDADTWLEQRSQIDRVLSLPAIDTISLNREIADICIKKNGVSIKIV